MVDQSEELMGQSDAGLSTIEIENSESTELEGNLIIIRDILNNETLEFKQKQALIKEVRKLQPALEDRWIYRNVVWALSGAILLSIIFTSILLWNGKNASDGLLSLGSASVGALAGLLTPVSKKD